MTFTDGQKIVIFKDEGGAYSYIKKKKKEKKKKKKKKKIKKKNCLGQRFKLAF
jgi:hypothetical protein